MLEWAKKQLPGKEYLADTALEIAMTMGAYCWNSARSNNSSSPTPSFNKKTTWMHPRYKHWHLIDYVLARQKDLKDILHTRVMPRAECHTDHRLVRCKLKLHFKPKPRKRGPPKKKFKLSKLQSAEVKADFQADLQNKLGNNRCP